MNQKKFRNTAAQFALPFFTIVSYAAISFKLPERGLLINLLAQPFWVYSSRKAYKEAGQIGIFLTTIIIIGIVLIGVVNYWIL